MTRGPYFDTRGLDFNSFLELRSGPAGPVGTLARFLEKVQFGTYFRARGLHLDTLGRRFDDPGFVF